MDKVVLTKEEAAIFSRNIIKMKQRLDASKDPETKSRTTYKLLESMQPQAEQVDDALTAFGEEPFEIEVFLGRKEKMLVRELLTTVGNILVNRVIPKYKEKLGTGGIDYSPYIVRNEKKLVVLTQMARKFK